MVEERRIRPERFSGRLSRKQWNDPDPILDAIFGIQCYVVPANRDRQRNSISSRGSNRMKSRPGIDSEDRTDPSFVSSEVLRPTDAEPVLPRQQAPAWKDASHIHAMQSNDFRPDDLLGM